MDFAKLISFSQNDFDILCKLLFAVGAGALVGIEREYHGRPAGLRTHILVALGAAIVAMISIEMSRMSASFGEEAVLRIDPGRIASGVVTGIGFLGAGAIIRIGVTARGLTTAASLWCMAIVGMGFGFGLYWLSISSVVLMLFTLFVLGAFEKKLSRNWYKTVTAQISGTDQHISDLINSFKGESWRVIDIKINKQKSKSRLEVEYGLRLNNKQDVTKLVSILNQADFVSDFSVS